MSTQSNNDNNQNGESHTPTPCLRPATGAKLPNYIVELLEDEEAFEVEQHLVDCHYCKERYLLVLKVRSGASHRKQITIENNGVGTWSNEDLETIDAGNR